MTIVECVQTEQIKSFRKTYDNISKLVKRNINEEYRVNSQEFARCGEIAESMRDAMDSILERNLASELPVSIIEGYFKHVCDLARKTNELL